MSYLYHFLPEPLIGDTLYPLNKLKSLSEELFKKEQAKYEGREYLMSQEIPIFNVFWNDVLHFSPLSPQVIYESLKEFEPNYELKRKRYLRFKASIFDDLPCLYMEHGNNKPEDIFLVREAKFNKFNSNKYHELTRMPDLTMNTWVLNRKIGKPLLWFNYVPHVLLNKELKTNVGEICDFKK